MQLKRLSWSIALFSIDASISQSTSLDLTLTDVATSLTATSLTATNLSTSTPLSTLTSLNSNLISSQISPELDPPSPYYGDDYELDPDQDDTYLRPDHPQSSLEPGIIDAETSNDVSRGGDTSIVQNNYNLRLGGHLTALDREGILLIISGIVIIVLLVIGIILLVMVLTKYLDGDNSQSKPLVVMPPAIGSPSDVYNWRHDPIYEIPKSYKNNGDRGNFQEHLLSPPKYDAHKVD